VSEIQFENRFIDLEEKLQGSVLWNEPLSRHTSLGIGGPARAFFYPANEEDLQLIFKTAQKKKLPVYYIGSGTNLLVSDNGFDGFILCLSKHFKSVKINGTNVYCQTGAMLGHFVKECLKRNLRGIETLIGIPGTIGGALRMNAGAYGEEISNYLTTAEVLTLAGRKKQYRKENIEFGYRYSSFPDDELILSASFIFETGHADNIRTLKTKASQSRKLNQPLRDRSAGSIFKNPPGAKPAGYLIDRAGLKGTHRGGAEISTKHANFIINQGNSSSEDITYLIHLIRKTIQQKFGVMLQLEIQTLGFSSNNFEV